MIKFENTEVFNWEGAIRGMRNPLTSWAKSDSYATHIEDNETMETAKYEYFIGENDLKLMKALIKAGSDHRKFMRQILVSVDITAPLYWWKEFDTYKVGTVANSCSTMHKIQSKPIELSDFSVDDFVIGTHSDTTFRAVFEGAIAVCESLRLRYLATNDKKYWRGLIQLLPESYNQKRTVTLNYEVLRNMYHARKNHKLDEWSIGFIEWVESLPYAKELIIE